MVEAAPEKQVKNQYKAQKKLAQQVKTNFHGKRNKKEKDPEPLKEVKYRFEDMLRIVEPYEHSFTTHTKKRWWDRKLLEVFSEEFQANNRDYYLKAIETGRIAVNGKKVGTDYALQNGDKIVHSMLRQETPVLRTPIEVLKEDSDVLIVNKPASMPVHPCGNFKYNSLVEILKRETLSEEEENKGQGRELKTVHRLDRQTSGVLFLAKTDASAEKFRLLFEQGKMRKIYLARVKGRFPEGEVSCDYPVFCVSHKDCLYDSKEALTENEKESAKDAKTIFKQQFYDQASDTSVVKCYPETGRTHQIRVHLKAKGHPIANDVVYGGKLCLDPVLEKKLDEFSVYQNDEVDENQGFKFMELWLHALEYQYDEQTVSTSPPEWAVEGFKPFERFS